MGRSKSSKRWLREHFDDAYVKRAQQQGWRSRSVFKLEELDQRYRLLQPGHTVVDLGCAPGGWCQYAVQQVGKSGRVVGLDILPVEPLEGVSLIHGDFTDDQPLQQLEAALAGMPVDLVLSDMAPNMSGTAATDQARSMYLAELAFDFANRHLKPGGHFLVKLFQGEGFDDFVRHARERFDRVMLRKPDASRPRSREVYLLAMGYRVE